MDKVIIFGGTGFIGLGLAAHLQGKGFIPVLIARNKPDKPIGYAFHEWDTVATGKQGMSWIHEHDMNEIIFQAISNEKYKGVYIASAPKPVSNKQFMQKRAPFQKRLLYIGAKKSRLP